VARHAGLLPGELPFGTDGCGLPTFGIPLRAFARALASAAGSDAAVQECQAAMAEHPWLIGGTGSFDTALVRAAGDSLTAKSGAAGIFGAVARDGSWALAIKLEAGTPAGLPQIAVHALQQLGLLATQLEGELEKQVTSPITNWVGSKVGEVRAQFEL
jgi:L-asparaginase II